MAFLWGPFLFPQKEMEQNRFWIFARLKRIFSFIFFVIKRGEIYTAISPLYVFLIFDYSIVTEAFVFILM